MRLLADKTNGETDGTGQSLDHRYSQGMGLDYTLNLRDAEGLATILKQFHARVLPELDRIIDLFPEYTPHNSLHIGNLVELKQLILEPVVLPKLSRLELFILDAAILSHDWGMAVARDEQLNVIKRQDDGLTEGPCLIRQFLVDLGWKESDLSKLAEVEHRSNWAEYIRRTHHLRSGQRIRQWFGPSNQDLGEAIALVAEGHGLEFRELENESMFQVEKSVQGENVNIQALAIYLRLIDLLDICKNRTPYEMWRFIKPKNERSALEWRKHAALRQPIRLKNPPNWLKIEAEPVDAETLGELHDLREWCLEEFDRGNHLLKRGSPSEYHYDLERIEFLIRPRNGLHSVPVRFTFDHLRTLELLGEEVYGHDPYVFLRELIQNALDASKTRRARRLLKGDPLWDELKVQVDVELSEDGGQTISVSDEGTGMDRYVIENYLSVAGASYYRSKDFQRLGLNFDPISRFGIGILSCFGVAESVEIETRTDPVLGASAEAWKIEIPARMRFWSIYRNTDEGKPGTKVKVKIEAERLRKFFPKSRKQPVLTVTEYLKTVVAWSDLPILINEEGNQTVILNPASAEDTVVNWETNNVRVVMSSPSLPFGSLFEAPDVANCEETLDVITFDLAELNLSNISGFLSYVVPKAGWFVNEISGNHIALVHSDLRKVILNGNQRVRSQPFVVHNFTSTGLSQSSKCDPFVRCYCNGVLVPETIQRQFLERQIGNSAPTFGLPWLQVNLTGEWARTISMDRGSVRASEGSTWDSIIFRAWNKYQAEALTGALLQLPPAARLRIFVDLWNFHWLNLEVFADHFPMDEWPVAVIDDDGYLDVRRWGEVRLWTEIPVAPRLLTDVTSGVFAHWLFNGDYSERPHIPGNWKGQRCVIEIIWDGSRSYRCPSKVSMIPIEKASFWKGYRYLNGPRILREEVGVVFYPPLIQSIYRTQKTEMEEKIDGYPDVYLRRVAEAPLSVPAWQLKKRPAFMGFETRFVRVDNDLIPNSFGRYFCWNEHDINVDHPLGELMCRIIFSCEHRAWTYSRDDVAAVKMGRAVRHFHGLLASIGPYSSRKTPVSLPEINLAFVEIVKIAVHDLEVIEMPRNEISLTAEDFLPGLFIGKSGERDVCIAGFSFESHSIPGHELQSLLNRSDSPSFGQTLETDTPWPPVG